MVQQHINVIDIEDKKVAKSITKPRNFTRVYTPRSINNPVAHVSMMSVDNIRGKDMVATPIDESDLSMSNVSRCEIHPKGCLGHLRFCEYNGVKVLIPPSEMCDLSSKDPSDVVLATRKLMSGTVTPNQYAAIFGNMLTGKSGILRNHCCVAQPNGGMRGVATPYYGEEPDVIKIPIVWLRSTRLLSDVYVEGDNTYDRGTFSQDGDNLNDTSDNESPFHDIFDERTVLRKGNYRIIDGTYLNVGIISRAPAISHNSVQIVKISSWDLNCIGTHTALCDGLHMDFDGDEVHVHLIVSYDAVMECRRTKTDYLKEMAKSIISDDMCAVDVEYGNPLDHTSTTVPILNNSVLDTLSYTETSAHKLFDHDKNDHEYMTVTSRNANTVRGTFISNARRSIENNIKSKLSVSRGYIYNRRMCAFTSMIKSEDGVTEMSTNRCSESPSSYCIRLCHPNIEIGETEISCVLNEIMAPIMQRLLDMAKGKHGNDNSKYLEYVYDDSKIGTIVGDMEKSEAIKRLSQEEDEHAYSISYDTKLEVYSISANILNELGIATSEKNILLMSYALIAKYFISKRAGSRAGNYSRRNTNLVTNEMSSFFSSGISLPLTTMCIDSIYSIKDLTSSFRVITEDSSSLMFRVVMGNSGHVLYD